MAINRYDTPAQAQFINTYSPIPFDAMMKIGAMKQANVEATDKLAEDTIGALGTIKVAPADEQAYLDKTNKIKSQIETIMASGAPGDYQTKRKLMSLRNQVLVDPELRSMSQNYGVYSDAVTQKQDAVKEGAISANMMDVNNTISALSAGGKGTIGNMKASGGSGVYNKGSWMKTVDVNKAMEQRINDVADSTYENAGLTAKDGNQFIIETSNGGKSLNALGAPLGIRFSTNEKGEQAIDLKNSNIDIFLATPEGTQLKNIAAERVQNGQAKDYATEVQRQYYSHALAAINERVSSKSTVRLAADPFDEARYKKELEDKVNPWSTVTSIASSASKLSSFNKTEEARHTIDNQIVTAKDNIKQFEDLYGVKPTTVVSKEGQSSVVYKDKNGVDVSEAYNLKQAEVQQLELQKTDIGNMVNRVKGEIGIPQTWEPNASVRSGAERARAEAEQKSLLEQTNNQGREYTDEYKQNATPEERTIAKEAGQPAYDSYIQTHDSTWAKLNGALKTNAAKSSVITSVTKFGSKELNARALAEFPLLMENDVQNVGDKRVLNVKEKEKLGITFAGKSGAFDPTKVLFGGSLFDPESQKMKFVYQSYDKNGKLSDPFMVDAPEGAVNDLIKSGATTQAKVIIHQQLSRLETNPDSITEVTLGAGEPTEGKVRKTSISGDPLKPKWLLTVNQTGADGKVTPVEKTFEDRTHLIDYYEAYIMAGLMKQQKK